MQELRVNISRLAVLFSLIFLSNNLNAQIFFNNGAQVTIKEDARVGILGGLLNGDGINVGGNFDNGGYVWIDGDLENNDDMSGDDGSVPVASSTYVLRGDWINNAFYDAAIGKVELDTSLVQEIRGSTATIFHDLSLLGSIQYNKKIQFIDASIDAGGTLSVNDAELATENNNMMVTNQSNTAVTHNAGFVSSLGDAYLGWEMSSTGLYEFPVGSSIGTLRKRVVRLTPETAAVNDMGVRFANLEATFEGYDVDVREQDICEIIRIFYHRIYQLSGNDNMDIDIQYVAAADGSWDFMVNWENMPAREWSITEGSGATPTFISVEDWTAFQDSSFAFGRELQAILSANPISICEGQSSQLTVSGIAGDVMLSWLSPIDPTLPSGTQTLPLSFNVSPAQTTQYIVEVSSNTCSIVDTVTVFVEPASILSVTIDDPQVNCGSGPLLFTADTSGGGPTAVISWLVNGVTQAGQNDVTFLLTNPQNGDIVRAEYTTLAGCSGSASSNAVTVTTGDAVAVHLSGSGLTICVALGEEIPLFASITAPSGADVTLTWESTPSVDLSCSAGCNTTVVTPLTEDTTVVVVSIVDNISGCSDADSITICGIDIPNIFVPTAFTPDGDTDNDDVFILGDLELFDLNEFRIYNRWGELVFSTDNFETGWNGTFKGEDQEMDVYTWYVNATFVETQEKRELKGVLALLR